MSRRGPSRRLFVSLVGIAVAVLVTLSLSSWQTPASNTEKELPRFEHLGMDFELESTHSLNSLSGARGQVVLLSFGFTSCRDICPLMLDKFRKTYDALGTAQQAEQVVMYFVTLDPARDTLDVMRTYLGGFHERIIGLRGSQAQLETLQQSLATSSAAITGTDQFSHSDRIFVFDTEGTLRAMPSLTDPVADIVTVVKSLGPG